ncbi:MAG: EAL domain-containing protein [Deltaproteobacteria bacterium]|nr:EAL domain-containing protein [Deltaproteobacteria bacterium]
MAGLGLRGRTLGVTLVVLAVAGAASYTLSTRALHQSRRVDEAHEAARAAALLAADGERLVGTARDYAVWDDTVAFVEGSNPGYLEEGLNAATFENHDLDVVVLLDAAGHLVWSGYQTPAGRGLLPSPPPPAVEAALLALPGLLALRTRADAHGGVVWIEGQPWLAAACPVLPSDGAGEPRGELLAARRLDTTRLEALADIAGAPFTLALDLPPAQAGLVQGVAALPPWLGGEPVRVVLARPPHEAHGAEDADATLAINLVLISVVSLGSLGILLDLRVMRRLARLSEFAARIRQGRAEGARLPVEVGDEIDDLAASVNALLDQVERSTAQLRHDALHDPLTGLANRSLLSDRLDVALARAARKPGPGLALLFLDLDRLKSINDHLGHAAGDHFIASVAGRLRGAVRGGDTVARIGGDEFAVLLDDVSDTSTALLRANTILAAVRAPLDYQGRSYELTASVGVSFPRADRDRDRLIRDADTAMYHAKQEGRDRVAAYDEALHGRMTERLQVEHDLRTALAAEQIEVWFQPIIRAKDGAVVGLEALARWFHPQRGPVPPDRFVAVAEESNLVVDLDRYVLQRACATLARLRAECPALKVAVNQSARQLDTPDFSDSIRRALADNGLEASALHLELTETLLSRNQDRWQAQMHSLRAEGVNFDLDDFGLGYSSLARLQALPINVIKLDRSFVAGLATDQEAISRVIVRMALELGKEVVAEGVEHPWQTDRLRALGCHMLQGYLFARPMPEGQVREFLGKRR